jgi:hypothetical protein
MELRDLVRHIRTLQNMAQALNNAGSHGPTAKGLDISLVPLSREGLAENARLLTDIADDLMELIPDLPVEKSPVTEALKNLREAAGIPPKDV